MVDLKFRPTYAGTGYFSSSNTVTITHNIGVIPTYVFLTWQMSPGSFAINLWVSAKTATTFTAQVSTSVSGTFAWLAVI